MLQKIKNIYHFLVAASALLFYRFPAKKLTVIGVTGTDGKTTTVSLIYHLLLQAGFKVAMISSVEARFGKEMVKTGLHVTTPDPWRLQRIIRQLVDRGFTHLVLEATSHGLDQHRLLGCNFKIAVFTNVTHEHLDYHQTWENYLKAKAKLLKGVKLAVLNQDDQSFEVLKKLAKRYRVKSLTYGLKAKAQLTPSKLVLKTSLPGEYNLYNCLAAIGAVNALGVRFKDIEGYLPGFKGIKGRMEEIKNPFGFRTFVDFAHTPNALEKALTALKSIKNNKGRLIAVFGAAGLRDKSKRPLMGKVSARLADITVLTAEDPRTEDVNRIIDQIVAGCQNKKAKIICQPDRQKAIYLAVKLAKKGDVVAVFGKGHEQSMCFGKTEHPWSDHQAVKKALKKRQ